MTLVSDTLHFCSTIPSKYHPSSLRLFYSFWIWVNKEPIWTQKADLTGSEYTEGEFRLAMNPAEFLTEFSEMAGRDYGSEFKSCSAFSRLSSPSVCLTHSLNIFPFFSCIAHMDRKFPVKVAVNRNPRNDLTCLVQMWHRSSHCIFFSLAWNWDRKHLRTIAFPLPHPMSVFSNFQRILF